MKYSLIPFLVLLIAVKSLGQGNFSDQLDSLQKINNSSNNIIDKLTTDIEIGKVFLRLNIDSAKMKFDQVYKLSLNVDEPNLAARALSYYAVALMYQSKNDSSALVFLKAKGMLNENSSYDLRTTIINNETINFYYQGKYDLVIKNFSDLAVLAEKENKPFDIAMSNNNVGLTYLNLGDYDQAMTAFIVAERYFEELNALDELSAVYNNIALIYKQIEDLTTALEYSRKEVAIDLKLQDLNGLSGGYTMMGIIFEAMGEDDSTMHYYRKSLAVSKEVNQVENIYGAMLSMAIHFRDLSQIDSAQYYFDRCIELSANEEIDEEKMARTYLNYGVLLTATGSYPQAKKYLLKGKEMAYEVGNTLLITFGHEALSQFYEKTRDYKLAFEHMKKFMVSNDSMINVENLETINALEIKYDTEKKSAEIALLSLENQLKDVALSKSQEKFYALIGVVLLILIIIYLGFNRYKNKQRALLAEEKALNQKQGFKSLIEGEEKERKRIAQELHDGLGQLLSSARLNVSAMEDNFEEVVTTQWNNSLKLIDDAVTEVRHISHNMMPNALITIGFEAAIKEQVHLINDAGKVKVHAKFPEHNIQMAEGEAISLYRVIQELLNNALKYAEAENIWLTIEDVDQLLIKIKDDGKGFDTKSIGSSTGIGWRNIQSRVDILNGQLSVESKIGRGAEVSLRIAV